MKFLISACRILVGILFIFSGLVKANDPLGLCYKMQEFFQVFHVNFLSPAALSLAVIMIGFEIIAGVALLLGFKMRIFGMLLLLLMIVFTFLTAYAFLSGRIKECGCFGDCLPISAKASFWKDVVLMVLVIFLFAMRKRIRPVFSGFMTLVLLLLGTGVAFGFQWYTLNHLPLVDCLAYKVGNNIPELMKLPPGAVPDQYETVFIYEKDGQQKEFSMETYPWQDSTWHYVDRHDKLVKKGNAEPEIKDFIIADFNGNDSTQQLLQYPGYTFLFMVKNVSEAGTDWDDDMESLEEDCARHGIKMYGITASPASAAQQFAQQHHLSFPFLQMDATVIKTAARSNPCLILMRKGVILGKWHYNDIPENVSRTPGTDILNLKR